MLNRLHAELSTCCFIPHAELTHAQFYMLNCRMLKCRMLRRRVTGWPLFAGEAWQGPFFGEPWHDSGPGESLVFFPLYLLFPLGPDR